MNPDHAKIDEAVLGLLYLTSFEDRYGPRAWKGHGGCPPSLAPSVKRIPAIDQ